MMDPDRVKRAVVVGAGVMGHSIALVFARARIKVGLVDLDEKALGRAMDLIESDLDTLAAHGSIPAGDIPLILSYISPSTDFASSADGVDFAIEAVQEVMDVKKGVFSKLEERCPAEAIIASNTSGLNIFSIGDIKRPERLIIAHWFTPAHIIPLVEVVPGPCTSPEVVSSVAKLMERLGKAPVILKEFVPAFIVNRFQWAMGDVAFEMLEKGWASPEDIDRALKLSLGIRLPIAGVMQNIDFNGLDLVRDILRNRGVPNTLMEEKVSKGHLGAKTSRGFYDYQGKGEQEILKKRDELYLRMIDHLEKIGAFEPV
jgi:3-hydroxybutyryl-CoA dehydrogenase